MLDVDRLMSEARAISNLIGNGVATIVVDYNARRRSSCCLVSQLERASDPNLMMMYWRASIIPNSRRLLGLWNS